MQHWACRHTTGGHTSLLGCSGQLAEVLLRQTGGWPWMQHLPCRAQNHVKPEELRSSLAKVRELAVQQCTLQAQVFR